jgi:hypothetical protein
VKHVKYKTAAAALMLVALTGCGEDRPSDKVAAPPIRQQAEGDLLDGLEIVDFQRANGQVDPDSANRYKITYTYRLKLTKPYPEAILAAAQELHAELQKTARGTSGSDFDLAGMQGALGNWQLSIAANQWVNAQGGGFAARRDALLGGCVPCTTFWNSEDAPDQAELRRVAYITAWSHFEGLAFKDEAKVGDTVERYVWRAFEKTEKGWMPSAL